MAKSFTVIDVELYKRAASGILQRCIPTPHDRELIRDIHVGVCGHHAVPCTLVGNAFRQAFYWPAVVTDDNEVVRAREGCQFYACKVKLLAHALQTIPSHPQTNGQVERANDMILQGLKPRIFDKLNMSGWKWLQELPSVIWSLRTTPSRAMGFTPFFLVYGAEAVLPTDLEYGTPKV
jgi:hypothetical protein